MLVHLICIGKTGKKFLEEGENEYLTRLKHYVPFKFTQIPDIKGAKNLSELQIKEKEGQLLIQYFETNDEVYLLDENGEQFSSMKFAQFFQNKFNKGKKNLFFIVGGPYGFSDELYKRANGKISLSKMTFSHQMIRLFFIEQVYRAMTILKNEPYHHQ